MFGQAEPVDPLQHSLDNAEFTAALHRIILTHPILNSATSEQALRIILKHKYIIALCEIGEPPLATQAEIDTENGRREMVAGIERTERDAYIGAYIPMSDAD